MWLKVLKLGIKAADYYLDSQCQRCVSLCLVVRSSLFTSGADSEPIFYNKGLHLLRGSVTSSNHVAGSLLFLLRHTSFVTKPNLGYYKRSSPINPHTRFLEHLAGWTGMLHNPHGADRQQCSPRDWASQGLEPKTSGLVAQCCTRCAT